MPLLLQQHCLHCPRAADQLERQSSEHETSLVTASEAYWSATCGACVLWRQHLSLLTMQ